MYSLKLVFNNLPKQTNAMSSFGWKQKMIEARRWKNAVVSECSGRAPKKPLEKVSLVLTRFSSREPDWDGLVSGFKHVIDGLKLAGIIIDDRMSVIGQPTYKWEKTSKGLGKIQVEVYERRDNGEKEEKKD